MSDKQAFNGFSEKALIFLKTLSLNNTKIWFDRNKSDYQEYLIEPLKCLVADLSSQMVTLDPCLEVAPAINKTISRIYRDTRFSKDKSPYKTHMWLTFKRPDKFWKDAPAYFFEISPEAYRYGMGYYSASPATMQSFRNAIDNRPKAFFKAASFYDKQTVFTLEGEQYKRIFDKDKPVDVQQWYQRKNLYLVCNRKIDQALFSRELVDQLKDGFKLLTPFYYFLWDLKTNP